MRKKKAKPVPCYTPSAYKKAFCSIFGRVSIDSKKLIKIPLKDILQIKGVSK